jgi:hypothetical protein
MPQFDIAAARKAGATDAQVADFLAAELDFDVAAARQAGASDAELADFLSSKASGAPAADPTGRPAPPVEPVDVQELPPIPGSKVADTPGSSLDPEQPLGWADVPMQAAENLPESAAEFAKSVVYPFAHPIETLKSFRDIGAGVIQHVRNLSPEEYQGSAPEMDTATADAVGEFYKGRYGSVEGFKRALANDPVGVMADAATVLTMGGGAAAKAPGVVGRTGRAVESVGATIDPVTMAAGAVGKTGDTLGKLAQVYLGASSGAGMDAVEQGVRAGRASVIEPAQRVLGDQDGADFSAGLAEAYRAHMRGTAPSTDLVDYAKDAMARMRETRKARYEAGMGGVKADPTVLDFTRINDALARVRETGFYKGLEKNPKAADVWADVDAAVKDWAEPKLDDLDPADPNYGAEVAARRAQHAQEYHTPEGLDALKQRIGELQQAHMRGTPQRRVADKVYAAVKAEINRQAPQYSRVMRDYEVASEQLRELERALSLGDKASAETAMRKIQSAMGGGRRFRRREELLSDLEDAGAAELRPAIAGEAFNEFQPRRLSSMGSAGLGGGGLGLGLGTGNPTLMTLGALQLAASSPRVVGEAAYRFGQADAVPRALADAALEAYRSNRGAVLGAAEAGTVAQGPDALQRLEERYSRGVPEAPPLPEPSVDEDEWPEELKPLLDGASVSPDTAGLPPALVKQAIHGQEGTGDNPRSSAVGKYQFLDDTFVAYARKVYPEVTKGLGRREVLALRGQEINGQPVEETLMDAMTADNTATLTSIGAKPTLTNLYVAHFFGPGDAPKVLRAPPETPLNEIVEPKVIRANPYLRGMTAGDAVSWAREVMSKRLKEAA